ncbi:hypothetical protein V2J09_000180 [Rumex salicifolius]
MKVRSETLTLVLVNLAGIMERADESLLPGVYNEVGAALHADPTSLGFLTLFRSVVQSLCYPLAAYLAVRHNRAHVIALGALLWSAATFLVAFSSTFFQVAVSRALNGIGLAIVIPAINSLVADSTDESNRGIAFGWLQLAGNMGSILGNISSIMIASTSFMGIPGWRIAFHLVAIVSLIVGILVALFANDPRFSNSTSKFKLKYIEEGGKSSSFWSELKEMIEEAKFVIRVPSFQIIVAQGVAGSFPWNGLSFAPMWMELVGFSHETTATLMTVFIVGGSLGSLFGGKMGDVLAKRMPNAGRIILSQISAGSVIPMAAILFLGLPDDPSKGFLYGLVLFTMGFLVSWNAPATNNPIFAEIVPEKHRTSIYALDSSFESVLSSFSPPLVGLLAQRVYGYRPVPRGSTKSGKVEIDRENGASLAKALFAVFVVPMALCVSIYSFLYCTYPRDRDRAKMHGLIESEIGNLQMKHHKVLSIEKYLEVSDEESAEDYLGISRGNVVGDDDNDERTLLANQVLSSD